MELHESEEEDELEEEEESSGEADIEEVTDNVGDPSVEINVEELIGELETQGFGCNINREQAAKRRLEELMEEKRAQRELEDFEDYEI
jgi:hypothetical protein